MNILALDTSTATLSVAVSLKDGKLFEINQSGELNHGETLLPLIEDVMNRGKLSFDELDGIVCCVGPGSFTGIRIGLSAANAFAMAQKKPVWGISTLEAMAWNARYFPGAIITTVDAQRGQYYRGVFQGKGSWAIQREEKVLSKEDLTEEAKQLDSVILLGDMVKELKQEEIAPSILLGDEDSGRICAGNLCHLARYKSLNQSWPTGYAKAVYHRLSQAEVQLKIKEEALKGGETL